MNCQTWEKVKFADVVEFPPQIKLQKGVSYPFVELSDINIGFKYVYSNQEKIYDGSGSKFENGDTLFARITPSLENGKIAQVRNLKNKAFGSGEFFIFRGKKDITDSDFIYYLSQTQAFRDHAINSMVGASGRQRADNKFVGRTEFLLPLLSTQKKIAKILSNYDDLIENNLKQIKLLEEKARLTYEEWFLRFRIDGQKLDIDENSELPFGWVKKKVGDLLGKVKSTVKIKTSDILSTGKYPVIDQSKDFVAGYTNEADINQYNDIPYIVFGDHTRVLKFVNFSFAKGADGTQVLISNSPRMPQVMFYHALINVDLSNYHYARHYKFLKAEEIIVPTLELAQRYEIFANTIFDQIKNLRNQNNLLKESRDILLPRLMTGMIDVEKLDIEV